MTFAMKMAVAFCVLVGGLLLFTLNLPQPDHIWPLAQGTQLGYRGTGMQQVKSVEDLRKAADQIPDPFPAVSAEGPRASEVYENVHVLGDLSEEQFLRVMTVITEWVSPEQGCAYCHDENDLAAERPYTKIVSRRMLEMTRHINSDWTNHVAQTGVTCYTCHRGNPVPTEIWFKDEAPTKAVYAGYSPNGQNHANEVAGLTSMAANPSDVFLTGPSNPRIVPTTALPAKGSGLGASIKDAEDTYALMIHLSDALGVNCTYCHDSRSFMSWNESSPPRLTAFHGLDLVRDLNANYLVPLQPEYPAMRLGPTGDAPKANCATCHQGEPKPLGGAPMVQDYPELISAQVAPDQAPAEQPQAPAEQPEAQQPQAQQPAQAPAQQPQAQQPKAQQPAQPKAPAQQPQAQQPKAQQPAQQAPSGEMTPQQQLMQQQMQLMQQQMEQMQQMRQQMEQMQQNQ
ncbi:photosynthetic reaction center cytochrome PufC [Afifella marina]|uniref:Photosynthetic reaction center cytochrome c subunit n=2 Tax=Hyphomicrobiales TaxID=356 RepID=A0A1G5P0K6_AFIMA|nr:photosynthetic reaction center cytochrome PufC [Afifella marina]SCZ43086.1 photosynthetic reaction center cytochrome c subunit [Afifella marina DSM 2698]